MKTFGHAVVLFLVFLGSSLCGETPEEMEALLRGYEGRWVGKFTIHSVATGFTETFKVEQQYWWKKNALHGVAVMQRKRGLESARSTCLIEDGSLISEIEGRDGSIERFVGVPRDGGIVWLPADKARLTDYQVTERIIDENGKRLLITEGFDTYEYKEKPAEVVFKGRLVLKK